MALFRFGITVQKNPQPEHSENGADANSLYTIPACFSSQESSSLDTVEYENVVSAVANTVNPHVANLSTAAWKRGIYSHYSSEIRANITKYAIENEN